MSKKVEIDDFVDLGVSIKRSFETHSIDPDMHYSLISDILFQCAYMIDEKTGSDHHERIHGLVDAHLEKFVDGYEEDRFVSSIRITLGVGKRHTARLCESEVGSSEAVKDLIERLLNIKQTRKTFEEITKRRKGIQSIGFSDLEYPKDSNWSEIAFSQGNTGEYEYSVDGICQFIIDNINTKI